MRLPGPIHPRIALLLSKLLGHLNPPEPTYPECIRRKARFRKADFFADAGIADVRRHRETPYYRGICRAHHVALEGAGRPHSLVLGLAISSYLLRGIHRPD